MCVYVRVCVRERGEGEGVRERWGREGGRERWGRERGSIRL